MLHSSSALMQDKVHFTMGFPKCSQTRDAQFPFSFSACRDTQRSGFSSINIKQDTRRVSYRTSIRQMNPLPKPQPKFPFNHSLGYKSHICLPLMFGAFFLPPPWAGEVPHHQSQAIHSHLAATKEPPQRRCYHKHSYPSGSRFYTGPELSIYRDGIKQLGF